MIEEEKGDFEMDDVSKEEQDKVVDAAIKGSKGGKAGISGKILEMYNKQLERAQNKREKATPDIEARSKNWDGY
jgi:hypothetical protein